MSEYKKIILSLWECAIRKDCEKCGLQVSEELIRMLARHFATRDWNKE